VWAPVLAIALRTWLRMVSGERERSAASWRVVEPSATTHDLALASCELRLRAARGLDRSASDQLGAIGLQAGRERHYQRQPAVAHGHAVRRVGNLQLCAVRVLYDSLAVELIRTHQLLPARANPATVIDHHAVGEAPEYLRSGVLIKADQGVVDTEVSAVAVEKRHRDVRLIEDRRERPIE
jgi:hypothetical protein